MRRTLAGRLRHVTTLVDNAGRENAHEPRAMRRAVRVLTSATDAQSALGT